MAKRMKMSKHHSKKEFSKYGSTTHRKNVGTTTTSMRGGIRL